MKRKSKLRWGTLLSALSAVGGVVLTVVSDPHVMASVAGKAGVSVAIVGAVITAVKKAVVREEHERRQ